ncbi:alanine--tRNA ligase [SAR202 cluster bacterium AC-647-N09_OGT_505m]|nr:alanine--tRNA ligase [SAR202 cluster bacterium AC-647-N09_OGT_505m]
MTGAEIREAFLRYFESKEHLRIPSSSLIPSGDSTLLLTNAGMVQFKPYFTGEMTPPRNRLTSVQKCFRTTDIDSVGDATHLTFFEMLGNFSVGDYFKKEAIEYAWEFVTVHLELEKERLWATVYLDDDEAFQNWVATGIPENRIRRFGEEDNYWGPAGNEGPCGPCSEIHYDFGEALGCLRSDCGPNCENVSASLDLKCDRFVELWNLVFMQYYQASDGSRTPLPTPNIDTGMGLERVAVILQGKRSIYDTDFFQPVVEKVAELCGKRYGQDPDSDYAIRVVAEHARSAAFLISDGVVPGNDGRDYVLRRVIRRAIRYGKKLGLEVTDGNTPTVGAIHESPLPVEARAMLPKVVAAVIECMKFQFPDLKERQEFILRVMGLEEERFGQLVDRGETVLIDSVNGIITRRRILKEEIAGFIEQGKSLYPQPEIKRRLAAFITSETEDYVHPIIKTAVHLELVKPLTALIEGTDLFSDQTFYLRALALIDTMSGMEVFLLYATYGFPPELTEEIAREQGINGIDWDGFGREMETHERVSRGEGGKFSGGFDVMRVYQDLGVGSTTFLGYETLTASSVIIAMLSDGERVNQAGKGRKVEVVLRETPFYAEMGGQIGDGGEMVGHTLPSEEGKGSTLDNTRAFSLRVEDTQAPIPGLTVHLCMVLSGGIAVGDTVEARVDSQRRHDTARNHTATHMLHAALRQVLGSHVRQHGSLVAPDRLRFDFTHVSPLSQEELREVERLTNQKIRENISVTSEETTYRQAVSQGALAFFGDRYGDQVRVVEVANGVPFSMEVCGGTHVHRTGDIGLCHVVSESSIGSGLRRIEAVTGRGAEDLVSQHAASLDAVARRLQVSSDELVPRVEGLLSELEHTQKRAESLERDLLKHQVAGLLRKQVEGINVVSGDLAVSAVDLLREAGDWLKNDLKSCVVILGTILEGRPTMLVMATKDIVEQGFHAGNVVKEATKAMGGGGGGRPETAQAGGRDPRKLMDAVRVAEEEVRRWRRNVPE